MSATAQTHSIERDFYITVLGRTLEHLGVQMYKRRDIAIAELIANSWDAGAKRVDVHIPLEREYSSEHSEITIIDDGGGMTDDQVQAQYLVVGRNRRLEDLQQPPKRPVMGRKGIGKLAGFGLASKMAVMTWKQNIATEFTLNVNDLQIEDGSTERVRIQGIVGPKPYGLHSPSGTRLILRSLKHKTAPDIDELHQALSRRFSRRVRGEMVIYINNEKLKEPTLELEYRYPETGYEEVKLEDGSTLNYYYAFTKSNITTKELQGFTIYVRGKTAQAPPFWFHVETVASGLHYARYMTGEIEADFLDFGTDNQSDIISTDRQEIDWVDERSHLLLQWGQALTRKALRTRADNKGDQMQKNVMDRVDFHDRIMAMDATSQKQVTKFLKQLGQAEPEQDRALVLADSLIRAYEYRHFHDVIDDIEDASTDPIHLSILLKHLGEWRVLESRAILEIIRGRLEVIEKFHSMIVNNAPETASSKQPDNMHDLLAGYPWILNPEWQVLAEEKKISTQLAEWNSQDIKDEDERLRYDFLALGDDRSLVIIEIKRSGHAVELGELQRLETYKERLSKANNRELSMVLICGGTINLSGKGRRVWEERDDLEIRNWSDIYEKTRAYYQHYRAVLEGDIGHDDFTRKQKEIAQTRKILQVGSTHRDPAARKLGLGPQDRNDNP